jgi:bifunctional polynucleotide phosphatase/kinase
MWKRKVGLILELLNIPITIYAACANDTYRKPRTGMWESVVRDIGAINLKHSFLVGDAAGREDDHSDADRHFCLNIGLEFFTPERFFLEAPVEPYFDKFDPHWFLPAHGNTKRKQPPIVVISLSS